MVADFIFEDGKQVAYIREEASVKSTALASHDHRCHQKAD